MGVGRQKTEDRRREGVARFEKPPPYGQCHIVFPHAHICINSGADALGGALLARRPPCRPVELWKDLILREESGTGASRADRGVHPTKSMQDPAYRKTMWNCPYGRESVALYQRESHFRGSAGFHS